MTESVEQQLRNALADYPEPPNTNNPHNDVARQVRRRRHRNTAVRVTTVAAIISILGAVGWTMWPDQTPRPGDITSTPTVTATNPTETTTSPYRVPLLDNHLIIELPQVQPVYIELMKKCYQDKGFTYGRTPGSVSEYRLAELGPPPPPWAPVEKIDTYLRDAANLKRPELPSARSKNLITVDTPLYGTTRPDTAAKGTYESITAANGRTVYVSTIGCQYETKETLLGNSTNVLEATVAEYNYQTFLKDAEANLNDYTGYLEAWVPTNKCTISAMNAAGFEYEDQGTSDEQTRAEATCRAENQYWEKITPLRTAAANKTLKKHLQTVQKMKQHHAAATVQATNLAKQLTTE